MSKNIPNEEEMYHVAELYKNFSDMTRVKILYALTQSDLCVNEISEAVNMSQSSVSHSLRFLKQSKLIKYQKKGKQVVYSLADEHVKLLLDIAYEHISE